MAFSVNTNANAMAALRSLSSTQNTISGIQSQIQSGLKVGSATDDPSTFVISQSMRGDIGALGAVKEGLNFGSTVINMALTGATAISNQLTDLQEKITQAGSDGTDIGVLQDQADAMIAQIDTIMSSSELNGINLLDNGATSADVTVLSGLGGATLTQTAVDATTTGLGISALDMTTDGAVGLTLDAAAVFVKGDTIVLTLASGDTHTFEYMDETGGVLASTVDEAGGDYVHAVTIATTDSTGSKLGAMITAMKEAGFAAELKDDGSVVVADGGAAVTAAATLATGTIATANVGGGAVAAIDNAKAAIGDILTELGTFSNRLESQAEFTQALNDTLEEGLGILVDANLAEVSAKLQSEQTKEQLGIQSLSIANASSQSILGLFR